MKYEIIRISFLWGKLLKLMDICKESMMTITLVEKWGDRFK